MVEQTVIQSLTSCPTASGPATRLAARHLERNGIDTTPLLQKASITPLARRTRAQQTIRSEVPLRGLRFHIRK